MRVWSGMEKGGVMERERFALLVGDWRGRGQQSETRVGAWLEEAGPWVKPDEELVCWVMDIVGSVLFGAPLGGGL